MLPPAHFAVGAAIGATVKPRWLAVPLAFGSHFLMDAIPHLENFGVLCRAYHCPMILLWKVWGIPWVIIGGLLLGWMIREAVATRAWGIWAFIAMCGFLAASPDLCKMMLPRTNILNVAHSAMHAHHDWGLSLHRALVGGGNLAIDLIPRSIPAYAGFLAEISVEFGAFWAGWRYLTVRAREVRAMAEVRAGEDAAIEEEQFVVNLHTMR